VTRLVPGNLRLRGKHSEHKDLAASWAASSREIAEEINAKKPGT
jgi:hypothetical protein